MKKAFRILGIILAVLILLVIAACFFAPKIARGYIEEHSKELIGRKMEIGNISFNPFRFTVTIDDFVLYENDDVTRFAAFHQFFVNADPSCLFVGDICLSELKIDSPYARVIQNGEVFNFTDMLEFLAARDSSQTDSLEAAAMDSSAVDSLANSQMDSTKIAQDSATAPGASQVNALPFGISIKKIAILSGNVIYVDQTVNSDIEIKDFSVKVPEVYFSNKNTSAGVKLEFASGGSLGVSADYNMQKGNFALNVKLSDFAIGAVKPYLESALNFQDLSGKVSVDISVSGNVDDVLASAVNGTVSVDNVVLTESSGKTLGVDHIGVGIAEANLNENRFVIDSVLVRGAFAHFDMNKNSNNLQVLLTPKKAAPADSNAAQDFQVKAKDDSTKTEKATPAAEPKKTEAAKPLDALLKQLSISDTKFTLNDNTIPGGFSYTVSGISVDAANVAFEKQTTVRVRATLPHGGSVKVSAKIKPSDLNSLQANIDVKNVSMKDFSKYSEHYTGYPLVAGSLGLASDNVIQNNEIDSRHNIDIYNLTVGDKPDNAKPEYSVPMKVALYILKDKDGKIEFDIPIKGNLNDPEFSYGKIIWQTVRNLLVKVALSPAKFLFGSSTPSEFEIDVAANDFTSEQYGIAKKWTEILAQKPGASMTILQNFDPKKQLESFALKMEKLAFYKATNGKENLTPVERKAALEAEEDDAFKQFVASWQRPSDEALIAQINALAEERNAKLLKALQAQTGVTAKNLQVRSATAAERSNTGKKSVFRMAVELP